MSGECVKVNDEGPVRVVTLNRPEKRNAIDLELRAVLAEALEEAMVEQSVRAVVLVGEGGTFCAGGDISTMRRTSPEETRPRALAAQRVIRAIWGGPKPVVAAVEGVAFGAGVSLALACDRVVAARDAVFSAAFTGVGLAGDMGIFASLPARVGPGLARQLMLMPRRLSGVEALEVGMVDAVCEPGQALSAAIADAQSIAKLPPLAAAGIKMMFARWPASPEEVLNAELALQEELFDTEDFAEGVAAFHERRPPNFRGL